MRWRSSTGGGKTMSKPFFSVIVPAHNSAGYIGKCLRSIRKQSFQDYELIVVCDSCTDNTERYQAMVNEIAHRLNFTSLKYHLLADVKKAVGLDPDCLCTYCFTGEE